ncbi:SCO3374 family protein [Streptomyces sp. NPDC006332]|uniref:SCO3374 family protein n=1 Tax=Streptomyces sp. NPDC006332 TaxID=3155456 RepID=UPI0033B50DF7
MVGTLPTVTAECPTVPLPRRPFDPSDRIRRWYENELGWPTVPAPSGPHGAPSGPGVAPVRLAVGRRFDVLDVPAEAGRAALRHLAAGSPVALQGDRMRFLVAAGSAEELPGVLAWLEWGALPLDLTMIGEGGVLDAPAPPDTGEAAQTTRALSRGPRRAARAMRAGLPPETADAAGAGLPHETGREAATGLPHETGHGAPTGLSYEAGEAGLEERERAVVTRQLREGGAWLPSPAGSPGGRSLPQGRYGGVQGAAVWVRPPEPGCEVEASLPTLSALWGGGGAPDLVRVLSTVATQCHRLRLRQACARPSTVPRARH